ncbi:putative BAH domain-containing protein [Helianthus anomalus]
MAQNVNSYTINGTNIIIEGMTCLFYIMHCVKNLFFVRLDDVVDLFICTINDDPKTFTSVAQVESLDIECSMVLIRWYYLSEETKQGWKSFNGIMELFLSNNYDVESIHNIQGK